LAQKEDEDDEEEDALATLSGVCVIALFPLQRRLLALSHEMCVCVCLFIVYLFVDRRCELAI